MFKYGHVCHENGHMCTVCSLPGPATNMLNKPLRGINRTKTATYGVSNAKLMRVRLPGGTFLKKTRNIFRVPSITPSDQNNRLERAHGELPSSHAVRTIRIDTADADNSEHFSGPRQCIYTAASRHASPAQGDPTHHRLPDICAEGASSSLSIMWLHRPAVQLVRRPALSDVPEPGAGQVVGRTGAEDLASQALPERIHLAGGTVLYFRNHFSG